MIVAPENDCSDIGKSLISSLAECLDAASSLGLKYMQTGYTPITPKGCYKSNLNEGVYWNTHETGMKHFQASPICRADGKYFLCYYSQIHQNIIEHFQEQSIFVY